MSKHRFCLSHILAYFTQCFAITIIFAEFLPKRGNSPYFYLQDFPIEFSEFPGVFVKILQIFFETINHQYFISIILIVS